MGNQRVLAAAVEFVGRKNKVLRPRGTAQTNGWWPHQAEKRPCCEKTPYPSGRNEWVKLRHCRTGGHVALLYGCDEKEMRRVARKIESGGGVCRREHWRLVKDLRETTANVEERDLTNLLTVWHEGATVEGLLGEGRECLELATRLVMSGLAEKDAWESAVALSRAAEESH